jgi:hypothetical protein
MDKVSCSSIMRPSTCALRAQAQGEDKLLMAQRKILILKLAREARLSKDAGCAIQP